ncbi:unnamed protein product [Dicrocoelium dendriticum]|nr:unnamed protein product [Dicrocoelium dendriticum]
MAHSSFARSLSEVSTTDGSLCRTLLDATRSSGDSSSTAASLLFSSMGIKRKTPTRTPSRLPLTPSCKESEQRSIPSSRKTPNILSKTPNSSSGSRSRIERGDRFIPNRQSTDIARAQHAIKENNENKCIEDPDYQRAVAGTLLNGDLDGTRILRFKSVAHDVTRGVTVPPIPVATCNAPNNRRIPRMPEKVLDAPEIKDDFYLNILDWSADDFLAIALGSEVYLWNASSGEITCLTCTAVFDEYVTSVSWSPDAAHVLAVGLSGGRIQLWDTTTQSVLRTMRLGEAGVAGRVPVVTWREHIVTSGCRSGHIRQHDTRSPQHEVGFNDFHTQEVCGLAWSPDKRFLASGANDNCAAVWPDSIISQRTTSQPVVSLAEHQAAVKALAWCPWKNNLLCTGGGTADHTLRFWNASTGKCAKSVDVVAQISGIIWNSDYREIVTSHGTPKNQLVIWRYPDITTVAELMEHQGRVLCIASSPNGEMVASCASDETLRIWQCFEVDHSNKWAQEKVMRASVLTRSLR